MDEDVEHLERLKGAAWARLGGLVVAGLAALGTVYAAWENPVLRVVSSALLGAVAIYLLLRSSRRGQSGRSGRGRRALCYTGILATALLVVGVATWTWREQNAPDLHLAGLRVAQLEDGGGSVLVSLDGGTRSDVITGLTLISAVEQIEACGGENIESLAVSPVLVPTSQDGGTLLVSGEHDSSLQPGAAVQMVGGMDADHCGDASWLSLSPQQPVQAGEVQQLEVEVPGRFEIESSVLSDGLEDQTVDEALAEGTFADIPTYEDYLRTIRPGMAHAVLSWPWSFDAQELRDAGWRAVLVVAATSGEGECVIGGLDLLDDGSELLPAEMIPSLDSSKVLSHLPEACT
ncbi:hypothetical protein [Ornithinimicrobium cerasi]|uniref:hypothetical protein n=1 Tax=Ornithinimicrobium cerasi TaxID=2248773 RepID=UPI000EFE7F47|nr:hypothetical protein [Ornithinimicrobium cerasi]